MAGIGRRREPFHHVFGGTVEAVDGLTGVADGHHAGGVEIARFAEQRLDKFHLQVARVLAFIEQQIAPACTQPGYERRPVTQQPGGNSDQVAIRRRAPFGQATIEIRHQRRDDTDVGALAFGLARAFLAAYRNLWMELDTVAAVSSRSRLPQLTPGLAAETLGLGKRTRFERGRGYSVIL